ncbi:hypothetical protein LMH87_009452 [Akanthomyces muscarius]|uniref:F-box domain-containing protein n=1 Tax=Akanthomyces muscarius TaxID=2231603 RepID=A0A9W8UJJ8_AKAMU|nr:hypothetical protein LMH87_009452 [Akanthomyces muscarius]KAJ4152934.1 hypothetical protein LMH87_009452 [Akanthomyces muscarius]
MDLQGRIPWKSRPKPLSNSQVGLFKWPDTEAFQIQTDVGTLGVLPLEILQHILQQLDIASLTYLDCVSKGMKRAVGSLPKLRALFGKRNLVIQAIWPARAGQFITCSELYEGVYQVEDDGA